jgi:hypothetical protein
MEDGLIRHVHFSQTASLGDYRVPGVRSNAGKLLLATSSP